MMFLFFIITKQTQNQEEALESFNTTDGFRKYSAPLVFYIHHYSVALIHVIQ